MSVNTETAGWRFSVAATALAVSILAVVWFAVAALGAKFGLWGWQFGLGTMTIGLGKWIIYFAGGLSLIALVVGLIKAPRVKPVILAIFAVLICAMIGFRLKAFGDLALSLPPIHDIQTDWSDPVGFSESLLAQRKSDDALNPVEDKPVIPKSADNRWPGLGGRLVSDVQEEAEGERMIDGKTVPPAYDRPIEPAYFDQSPGEVAAYAITIAEDRGWEIFSRPKTGQEVERTTLEATDTTGWYGFKDDVAVRIRAVEGATRVDMRSISRVGLSDLGANARRVSSFMDEIKERANGRDTP